LLGNLAGCSGARAVEESQSVGSSPNDACAPPDCGPVDEAIASDDVSREADIQPVHREPVIDKPQAYYLCYGFEPNSSQTPHPEVSGVELTALQDRYRSYVEHDMHPIVVIGEADPGEDDPDALSLARAHYVADIVNDALQRNSPYWNPEQPVVAIGVGARTGYTHCPGGDVDNHRVAYWPNHWELDEILSPPKEDTP